MTQDEILAALREVVAANNQYTTWTVSTPHLVALVNLAIDREREACAKLCDELDQKLWEDMGEAMSGYGDAIRERT
jgi:hypothetical protein